MLGSQTPAMHTHDLNTCNHTGERPQGCQAREHVWRQLLKLVPGKVQRAVAKQKVEIDQIELHNIVSARDRDSSGDVFVRFRSSCGIIICDTTSFIRPSYHSIRSYVGDTVVTTLHLPARSLPSFYNRKHVVSLVHISSHSTYVTLQTADWKTHPAQTS
jgi:hypothetical protein